MWSLWLAALSQSGLPANAERPPTQTALQKEILKNFDRYVEGDSGRAKPDLLSYLDTPEFRNAVTGLKCANWSAYDLLDFYTNSMHLTNVIASFTFDHFDSVLSLGYLPNKWELQLLGLSRGSIYQNWAETNIMRFPNFTTSMQPTQAEAYDRIAYLALNIWRVTNGFPQYGDMIFVLNPKYLSEVFLLPGDSGWYVKSCVFGKLIPGDHPVNCTEGWGGTRFPVGNTTYFHHLILAHNRFHLYPLSDLFKRLEGKLPATADNWYYEAAMAGSFYIPEKLHYTILPFGKLWGTADGTRVQAWSVSIHRPQCWSGDGDTLMLDPVVNLTVGSYVPTAADQAKFKSLWDPAKRGDWRGVYNQIDISLRLRLMEERDTCYKKVCHTCHVVAVNLKNLCMFWQE